MKAIHAAINGLGHPVSDSIFGLIVDLHCNTLDTSQAYPKPSIRRVKLPTLLFLLPVVGVGIGEIRGRDVGRRAREIEQLVDGRRPRLRGQRGDLRLRAAETGAPKQMCDVRDGRHVVSPLHLIDQTARSLIDGNVSRS